MQKILKAWLKKIFSDLHSTILSVIVLSAIGTGGASLALENVWNPIRKAILLPIPLWISIVLILAIYTSFHVIRVRPLSSPVCKIKYYSFYLYTWKTKIYDNGNFEVDKTPICLKHDLLLLHNYSFYYCPETIKKNCINRIPISEFDDIYKMAKSYIDRQIRNNKK